MKLFDFNIHLPELNNSVQSKIESELNVDCESLIQRFENQVRIDELSGGNVMIFNQNKHIESLNFVDWLSQNHSNFSTTLLFDFRQENWKESMESFAKVGGKCIKFHSYVQKIEEKDYAQIAEMCLIAEELGLIICLDASYGSVNMLKYDIVSFICEICAKVKTASLVILHSGGLKCVEMMLLAMDCPNVYLETSFSLPFYQESRVAEDLKYVYKKLGANRLLYASDVPYVSHEDSLRIQKNEFKSLFSEQELELVFHQNAKNILGIE